MEGFDWKSHRDNLAKTLKESPKEERGELLEIAQSYPEYDIARSLKLAEQEIGSADPAEIPQTEDDEIPMVKIDPARETAPPLPPTQHTRALEAIQQGPENLARYFEEKGFTPTKKAELLQYYTRELEESIRLIAWTKPRLMYAVAILEHTLDTSERGVTSTENMIQNYLIFCKTFAENEGKTPRYGQFAYVMRSVFGGVTSKEEIYDRIAQHKTFGEQSDLDRSEIEALTAEVQARSAEIHQEYLAAQEKKRRYDESLHEAREIEEVEKGTTWSPSLSKPKEYEFPNYTFQTGPLKGQNRAVGRSSWEPMLLAYADVVNKRTEDRINAKTDITEQEKTHRINEQRIELLYEQFEFPVDVKVDAHGVEKPVIYILDFIDINRWRAVEVKGPLTPKAAEKIRLFKKYYVDGDFSDLPDEKKMVMMTYVQNKKDEIADWCHEHGYPVYDHFSSIEVLGAFKWDHDLNNFNRYREVRGMKGVSKREQDLMQKGFFKQVEDRIASGKTPDIRPAGYFKAEKVQDLVQVNEAIAKARKVPYAVERPITTKPYLPSVLREQYKTMLDRASTNSSRKEALRWLSSNVLDTIPLSPEQRGLVMSCTYDILPTFESLEKLSASFAEQLETEVLSDIVLNDGNLYLDLEVISEYVEEPITSTSFAKTLSSLERLHGFISSCKENPYPEHTDEEVRSRKKDDALVIKELIKLHSKQIRVYNSRNVFVLDKNALGLNNAVMTVLRLTINRYVELILGENYKLWQRRVVGVTSPVTAQVMFERQHLLYDYLAAQAQNPDKIKDPDYWGNIVTISKIEEGAFETGHEIDSVILMISNPDPSIPETQMINYIRNNFPDLDKLAKTAALQHEGESQKDFLAAIQDVIDLDRDITRKSHFELSERIDKIKEKRVLFVHLAKTVLELTFGEEKADKLLERVRLNLDKY